MVCPNDRRTAGRATSGGIQHMTTRGRGCGWLGWVGGSGETTDRRDAAALQHTETEARVLATLRHPNVVALVATVDRDDRATPAPRPGTPSPRCPHDHRAPCPDRLAMIQRSFETHRIAIAFVHLFSLTSLFRAPRDSRAPAPRVVYVRRGRGLAPAVSGPLLRHPGGPPGRPHPLRPPRGG